MAKVEIKFPTLYGKQHRAFFCKERISCTEATTKGGKSAGALVWICTEGINSEPASSLWLEPVFALAKVMFERVVRMFTRMDPERVTGWDLNRTDLVFTLPGGGRIFFMGSDRPDLIYGRDYARAVVDEASRCKEEAWHAVRSTTTATRGKIRLIGNVKGRKNWFYKLARKAEAGEPGLAYHKITWRDAVEAGVLDAEEIEDARRVLPEMVFQELYEAEAASDTGNPFGDLAPCIGPLSDLQPMVWGWDLAKSIDWTVGIALDQNGAVCRFERFQKPWEETLATIARTSGPAYIDATGVGDPIVEQLQRSRGAVTGVKFTAQSKQQLMEGLAVAIAGGKITFPDGPIVSELESFEYEYTRTGVRYAGVEGMHDDCVCALALAVSGFQFGYRPVSEDALEVIEREDWLAPWA